MPSEYSLRYRLQTWVAGEIFRLRHRSPPPDVVSRAIARPRRVLLVAAGMLGDTVMIVPVIQAARRVWPAAELTLLGRPQNCELLRNCPEVDRYLETTVLPFALRRRAVLRDLARRLKQGHFDVALLLLGDQFARMVADAGIPVRVGVRGRVLAPCLTHTYEIGSARTWGPDERLSALRVLGFDVCSAAPRMSASRQSVEAAAGLRGRLGLHSADPYAVLHPFGSVPRKWWPVDRLGELAQQLERALGLRSVLVGGPEARGALPADARGRVVDAVDLTITELVGVIAGAALVISTDSGPFHLAGALGRPLVGLFRSRYSDHGDRYPRARIVLGEHADCVSQCDYDRCCAIPCRELSALTASRVLEVATAALAMATGRSSSEA